MLVEIGTASYLLRITSPGSKVIGGEFKITKDGLLAECERNGFLSRICILEGIQKICNRNFCLEWVLQGVFSSASDGNLQRTQQLTATTSMKQKFHSSDFMMEIARMELEDGGWCGSPEHKHGTNSKRKKKDSGYSGGCRSSEEHQPPSPLRTPTKGDRDSGFGLDYMESPDSSSSDDGRDIYSPGKGKALETTEE